MPQGCAVIGGAARSLAFSMINKNLKEPIPIRDVDVAFFSDEISQDEADNYARYFSPDDFSHGHGAQEIFDIEEYMESRDLTMNQVLYKDGRLFASRRAIKDIYNGVINPCEDRYDEWGFNNYPEEINTRTSLKMILQETVLSEYAENIRINNFDKDGHPRFSNSRFFINNYENYNGFQLALAIQKSFEYGEDIPQKFLRNLAESSLFENSDNLKSFIYEDGQIRNLYDIMSDLNENVMATPFEFRNAAAEYYFNESSDREFEEMISKYEFAENLLSNGKNFRGNMRL